jgi:hypothetical protein
VNAPVTELAAYFQSKTRVPDEDLVRLTSAARAAGGNWEAIAATCGVREFRDAAGIVSQPSGIISNGPADLLFQATQRSLEKLSGSHRYPALTWPCPGCQQQVTDRAATGRPAHMEHGHVPGCARLAHDQAADAEGRRARLPGLTAATQLWIDHFCRQADRRSCRPSAFQGTELHRPDQAGRGAT